MSAEDAPIGRFPIPRLETLPDDIRARIEAVQEKSGFVPNVFLVLAHRPDEFRAFFAYHDALMDRPGNLTKAEREMIVVATSAINQCQYCVIAHGAILRIRAKDPLIADQVAINYRKADITDRQKAMLDFAMLVSQSAHQVGEAAFAALRAHRIRRRGCLGHRRHRGLLRPVEPAGERHQPAPQPGILRAGARLTARRPRRRRAERGSRSFARPGSRDPDPRGAAPRRLGALGHRRSPAVRPGVARARRMRRLPPPEPGPDGARGRGGPSRPVL